MAMLEALAAFALAMVAFSTMVSAIVEMIHRFVNLRQKGFERMLERLYVDVIKPRVGDALKPDAKDFVAHVAHIRGLPTRPTIQEAIEKKSVVKMIKALWTPIGAWFVPHTENKITPIQLIERLAETDVGKAIAAQGRGRVVAVVEDIALQFERLGDSTRDYFAQRAYALSIIVSVLLALAANIDAGRLFTGFLENPESRAKLLATADGITAAYETQAQSLAKAQAEKKTPEGEAAAAADKLAEDTKKKAADIRAEIVKLSGLGLAIGHDYYPWCETRELTIDAEIKIARLEGRLLREPSAKYGAALPPIATPVRDARCRPYFDKLKVCYAKVERQDQSDCLMRAQDSYLPSGAAAAPGALIP